MRRHVLEMLAILLLVVTHAPVGAQTSASTKVLRPDEGHVQLSSAGVATRFEIGSVSTGARGTTLVEATFPPGHQTATHLPRLLVGISRGDAEECFRVLFARDSTHAALAEAMSNCRVRMIE